MRDGVGGVGQRRPDVVRGQSGIRVQEIFDRRSLSQLAEQKFHRYACSANYGLSLHDTGIDLDAISHVSIVTAAEYPDVTNGIGLLFSVFL